MDIFENRAGWLAEFQAGWLAIYQATGAFDWKRYPRPKNTSAPGGPGIDLAKSRLLLISSAGGYLREEQAPFAASDPFGDYTLRLFPTSTTFEGLAFAHEHYDHTAVEADPQVLLPLRNLEALVSEGAIGALTPSVISFMGYQPFANRTVDETIPAILEAAIAEQADAALLVPS